MNFRWAVTEISLVFIIQVSLHKGYTILILGGVGSCEPLDKLWNTAGERERSQRAAVQTGRRDFKSSDNIFVIIGSTFMNILGQPHQQVGRPDCLSEGVLILNSPVCILYGKSEPQVSTQHMVVAGGTLYIIQLGPGTQIQTAPYYINNMINIDLVYKVITTIMVLYQ